MCILMCSCSAGPALDPDGDAADLLIQAFRNDAPQADIDRLLDRLSSEEAVYWREIVQYRQQINQMNHSEAVLPDDLPDDDSVCFVVLGYALNSDGSMKPELTGRLETALDCALKYPEALLLCTGGGTASGNAQATEADAMTQWLSEHGISKDRILTENRSLTTTQNAIFSLELIIASRPQIRTLVIVTSDYHIPWGAMLFQAACILDPDAPDSLRVAGFSPWKTETTLGSLYALQASGIREICQTYKGS